MNSGEWMVVIIVAMAIAARVYRDRCGMRGNSRTDRHDGRYDGRGGGRYDPPPPPADDAEARRLRDEVRSLKERIAVLERIATDHSTSLDREIESLRDRP